MGRKGPEKSQVKLYLQSTLLADIRKDAEEFGLSSAPEVIEQIIVLYRPFWRKIKQAEQDAYQQQFDLLDQALSRE